MTRSVRLGFDQKVESISDMWLRTTGDEKDERDWDASKSCRKYTDNGTLNRRTTTFIKAIYNNKPWPFLRIGRIIGACILQGPDEKPFDLSLQRSVKYSGVYL